jgi:hypothetical protein
MGVGLGNDGATSTCRVIKEESMAEGEIDFIQIAGVGDRLYGLTKEGDVWAFDRMEQTWKRVPMAFKQAGGRPGDKPA